MVKTKRTRIVGLSVLIALVLGLVAFLLFPTISMLFDPLPAPQRAQVDALLTRYNLHQAGSGKLATATVDPAAGGFFPYAAASKAIGLDLESEAGKAAQWYSFPLVERSQGPDGDITASFVFIDGTLVGAGLHLVDYAPGVVSLSDRGQFAPQR